MLNASTSRRGSSLRRIHRATAVAGASALALAGTAHGQAVYIGPVGGDWGTASNWSTLAVPTTADNVVVDSRAGNFSVVTGVSSTRGAANLTINAGDSVEVSNASDLNIAGNLSGAGTLRFNVSNARGSVRFDSATATIAAGSLIDFNYQGTPVDGRITGPATGTLTNSGLIRGGGTLDNIRFTNAVGGILENYQSTAQLYLDANNGSTGLFTNNGTIRALAGATVTFAGDNGGDFVSTSGLIQANGAGAIVRFLNNASVTGGTYSTSGGGQIVVEAAHSANANNFTNQGLFVLRNGCVLNVSGTITNTGTINFTQPYTNEAFLTIAGDTTLTGAGGVIQMDYNNVVGAPAGVINGTGTLTIGSGQTIRGVGSLRNLRVQNAGLIDANSSAGTAAGGSLYLDANNTSAGLFTNTGTIRSSAGGDLIFSGDNGGDFVNTGGTIASIGTGSLTELYNNATVTGGTITTNTGGVVRVRPGQIGNLLGPITISSGSKVSAPTTATSGATYLSVAGTFTNAGTIELNAAGALSLLTLQGDATINGGTLSGLYTNVSNSPGPRIDTGGSTLTLASGTTAQGVIFFNNAKVINNGTINANDPAGIYLDPSNAGGATDLFVNNNLTEATGGGQLVITGDSGGGFRNNGTLAAIGAGSSVDFYNAVVSTGGTYTTSGGGVIRVRPGQAASLVGPITISSGSKISVPATTASGATYLYLAGTVNNGGTIEMNAAGALALLNIAGNTTINGGTVTGLYTNVSSSPGTRIDTGANTLTLSPTTTVQGVVAFNNAIVVNNGTINANDVSGMYVDPSNQGSANLFVNNGLMEATNGGLMVIAGDSGGELVNTSGTLASSGANSIVELFNSMVVRGGTLTTSSGGVMRVRPGQVGTLAGPMTISAGSKFTVPGTAAAGGTYLYTAGTYTNNGTIELNASGALSLLSLIGDTTIAGTGVLNGAYGGTGSGPRIDTGASVLTIAPTATVSGVVFFNNARVINNGTILANNHAVATGVGNFDMYVDASNTTGTNFVNNGTIRATNNAALGFTGDAGGTFSGAGPLVVDSGALIGTWNGAVGDMGPVSGAGTYRAAAGSNLGHQSFRVNTLEAVSAATARIIAGGGNTGTSKVSTLTVDSASGARVDVTDHGLIVDYTGATPAATIRGYLASGRNGGAWNGAGIDSSLANSNGKAVGYGEASVVFASPTSFLGQPIDGTSILIRFTLSGDANLDGAVNFADLVKLAQSYNTTNAVWTSGDFDYDGNVAFSDLVLLAQNYNASLPPGVVIADQLTAIAGSAFAADFALAQSLVPEPTGVGVLLGIGAIGLRRCSRRGRLQASEG